MSARIFFSLPHLLLSPNRYLELLIDGGKHLILAALVLISFSEKAELHLLNFSGPVKEEEVVISI